VSHADVVVDGPMVPLRHRVVDARRELPEIVTIGVEALDAELDPMAPGQFNMLWTFGGGEVPISVSRLPGPASPMLHTIRAVGAATSALCALRPGDVIGVRGPFGTAWGLDRAKGRDVVVVAGGLGMAPLRPVVETLLADRRSYGDVAVLIGARSPDAVVYLDEILTWRDRGDIAVGVTVDHAGRDWWGDVGLVTGLLPHVRFDPARTSAFVCGPELMMRFTAAALAERGVPAAAIQVSLERNMQCAIAHCGHCQLGPTIVCRDGAVYPYAEAAPLLAVRGL
jgi:anaerobic sulfite reductase subunit B